MSSTKIGLGLAALGRPDYINIRPEAELNKSVEAFKTNALFQVENISEDEAKQEYIDLVNNYFLYMK